MTHRYCLLNLFIRDLLHLFDWEKNTMVQKNLEMLIFFSEGGKPANSEKNRLNNTRINSKLNLHMA